MHARPPLRLVTPLLCIAAATAQNAADATAADGVSLVSRAEALLKRTHGDEDGLLLLWQALDALRAQPANPIRDATVLSARYLLKEHDPLEEQRRQVFTRIATLQVELAKGYRLKKWFETAAQRLEVAADYDPDATAAERAALAKLPAAKPAVAPATSAATSTRAPEPCLLLQRKQAVRVFGKWEANGEVLACEPHPGNGQILHEWTTGALHSDNEIVVEFRAVDPKVPHNVGVQFGLAAAGQATTAYHLHIYGSPATGQYAMRLLRRDLSSVHELASAWVKAEETPDGWHRVSVQVRGAALRAQLDGTDPLEATASEPVRGQVGVVVGCADAASCALQFRNLRVDPLPADAPSDDELRRAAEQQRQDDITKAVDGAQKLLAQKQPEAAAHLLHDALALVLELPTGVLRDNLRASIVELLQKADPLAKKQLQTAVDVAAALGALADQYATAGRPRQAQALMQLAMPFDHDGQHARAAAIEQAVAAWNVAQATARASELAPPADDGTLLRAWFATGKLLDSRCRPWQIEGPAARIDPLPPDEGSQQLPKTGSPAVQKASIHVHLPAEQCQGGLCFDVAGPHDYDVGFLLRGTKGMVLMAFRYANGRWTELGRRKLTLDPWRLDAWYRVEFETTATGIVLRCAGVELPIERKVLGAPTGRIALHMANNGTAPATIELRAFAFTAK